MVNRRQRSVRVVVIVVPMLCVSACARRELPETISPEHRSLKQQIDPSLSTGRGGNLRYPTVGMVFDRHDRDRETPVDQAARLIATNQSKFPLLEWLWFDGTDLTDSGLLALSEIRSLKVLSVVGTQVTEAGAAKFRTKLPDCRLDHQLEKAPQGIAMGEKTRSWDDVPVFWKEVGLVPDHPRLGQLDIKRVYVTNTPTHLHFYIQVRDTIPELLARDGSDKFTLFIDTDHDPSTGSIDRDNLRVGYDFRYDFTTGTKFAAEDQPSQRYFGMISYQIPSQEHWYDLSRKVARWHANGDDVPFGYNRDGIEFALSLDDLAIASGQSIRIAIHENHFGSGSRRYIFEKMFNERVYKVK